MSRIGKAPIKLPEGVVVHEDGKTVVVEGPKGKLEMPLFRGLVLSVEKDNLKVVPDFSDREFKSQFWGLQRSLSFSILSFLQITALCFFHILFCFFYGFQNRPFYFFPQSF